MNTNLNMQTMPIDRLKPAKYNPRKDLKPGDPAYEKIRRSLHDFGYVDPIRSVWSFPQKMPKMMFSIKVQHQMMLNAMLKRQVQHHLMLKNRR